MSLLDDLDNLVAGGADRIALDWQEWQALAGYLNENTLPAVSCYPGQTPFSVVAGTTHAFFRTVPIVPTKRHSPWERSEVMGCRK